MSVEQERFVAVRPNLVELPIDGPIDPHHAIFPGEEAISPRTLCDILAASVAACPEAAALDDGQVVLDYAGLAREVEQLAGELRSRGIGSGDRVGIRIPSGNADLYVSILAVLAAGAAYVPVDSDDPDERAELIWEQAGVCAVLGAARELVLRKTVFPGCQHKQTSPDDDAWIIFTSGTTGAPKGVAVTHRSAAAFVDAEARLFLKEEPIGTGDRVLAGLSVAFDASCEEMWLAWRNGACLTPAPRSLVRSGADLGPWLLERKITVVSTVPTLASLWPSETLDHIRLIIFGGEACPQELADRLVRDGREVWNTYGPTEATVVACAAKMSKGESVRIGLPLLGWRLAVVDQAGYPVAWGETGELVIGGVGLARYLDPVKDREKYTPFSELGWERGYHSGDLVRADPAGLIFVGRADDQVKIGGRRIELGEIDAALRSLPEVAVAATAVRHTASGAAILVGYVQPSPSSKLTPAHVRQMLEDRLPSALIPRIAMVDTMPMRTSGKVDRAALPWPLIEHTVDDAVHSAGEALTELEAWLADKWSTLLGVQASRHSDFFELGGSSLTAAQSISLLRKRFPAASIADVYQNPTLATLAKRLEELRAAETVTEMVRPTPRKTGFIQAAVQLALATVTGLRWLLGLSFLANVLNALAPDQWTIHTSWWFIVVTWVLLFSAPGRLVIVALGVRALCGKLRPGSYARGGRHHLCLWTAERLAATFGIASFTGTPLAGHYARALGCRVGKNVELHTLPPVTGMAQFDDYCALESEVDIAGWWIDGDRVHIGNIHIGQSARIGTRATVMPGAVIGDRAEVSPGSVIEGRVPENEHWGGSPARLLGVAGEGWPAPRFTRSRRWRLAYLVSLPALDLLPLVAALPALVVAYYLVKDDQTLGSVLMDMFLVTPAMTLLSLIAYCGLVVLIIRLVGRGLRSGFYPVSGGVAWRAWLTQRLMNGARGAVFPLYASLATPTWLRLLGVKVGRKVEASTVLPLPTLTKVDDGAFLADDTLTAPAQLRAGWIRLGESVIGERAFVGNSAIVGPDRTLPKNSLVAVLSDVPAQARINSSWLGRPALEMPRQPQKVDLARTFNPPPRLVLARTLVEFFRILPMILSALLGQVMLAILDEVDLKVGLAIAASVSGVLVLGMGIIACLITTMAKWLLVGRFRASEHPLWSSFVWRNELFDNFVEVLAVPWLAGSMMGTPALNWWFRTLGAKIGRGVWCDTYWLPEPDLIEIGTGSSVNRGVVLQTHLFHDRLMRLDRVCLASGATLGPHSVILPGATIESLSTVGPASLVMRGEKIPAASQWLGNPVSAWSVSRS